MCVRTVALRLGFAAAALIVAADVASAADHEPRTRLSRQVAELTAQVQQLRDKEEIRQQIVTYARAMDRIDTDLAKTVFHRDAYVDYGAFKGRAWAFLEQSPDYQRTLVGYAHQMSTMSIWLLGPASARSETYGDTTIRSSLPDGSIQDRRPLARYIDEWVKADGRWQIMRRTLLIDLDQTFPPQPAAMSGKPGGSRDRSDPSYFPER